MPAMARTSLLPYLNPLWLLGPLADKELRVASRRRQSYTLRFLYVALLTAFVVGAWHTSAHRGSGGSLLYQVSRMGTAGRYVAVAIVWFQYVAAQFLALTLLGDAIGGEVKRRTLSILAATPLGGLQIVGGKLAGGLLHILMLVATSLPLLAIVRVFGGVSWDYVLSGVCLTLAATVFIGALSLAPLAYPVYARWGLVRGLWFCLLITAFDRLVEWLERHCAIVGEIGKPILQAINPTDVLLARTREMLAAQPSTGPSSYWPVHCLMLLAGSVVVLLLTARRLRAVAGVIGPMPVPKGRKHPSGAAWVARMLRAKRATGEHPWQPLAVRRVEGSPVLWKELRNLTDWQRTHPVVVYATRAVGVCLFVAMLIGIMMLTERSRQVSSIYPTLVGATVGFHIPYLMGLAAAAAAGIAKEREARTLAVLLTTPLRDEEIVKDKAHAIFRLNAPSLVSLLVLVALALCLCGLSTDRYGPMTLLSLGGLYLVILLGFVPFLLGLGLYCGARLRTQAAAGGCLSASFFGLLLVGVIGFASLVPRSFARGPQGWLTVLACAAGAGVLCGGIGLLFLRAAARQLRRHVF